MRSEEVECRWGSRHQSMSGLPEIPVDCYAEELLLGTIVIDSRRFRQVRGIVRPEDFFDNDHRAVFEAIGELSHIEINGRCPVDVKKLHDHLVKKGRRISLLGYAKAVGTGFDFFYYAHRIVEVSTRRRIYLAGLEMIHSAADVTKPVEEVLESVELSKDSIEIVERFVKCF